MGNFPQVIIVIFFLSAKEKSWRTMGDFPASILLKDDPAKKVTVPSSPLPVADSGMHRVKTI